MCLLKVALLQMTAHGNNQAANQVKGENFCRDACMMGADIALFPEMWNNGYSFGEPAVPGKRHADLVAISQEDAFITHFRTLARELNMAIALTYLEKWDGAPRNSVSLIDRHGQIVLTYAKVHTCEFSTEVELTPGEDFPVCTLNTAQGEVKIGFMICYDREFPESARILMLQGAEIILTPNACTLDAGRIGQFRTRAFENMVGVAMTNYAAPQYNGHSIAFDAVSYLEPDGKPCNPLLVEAGEREGIYMAQFDLNNIRIYRERECWGNAYRRPRCYDLLTSLEVQPPFIRFDATR